MKTCIKCGEEKDESEFYNKTPTRLDGACKVCKIRITGDWGKANRDKKRAAWRRYKERHPERLKENVRKSMAAHRLTPKGRAKEILDRMKARSSENGFPPPEFSRNEVAEAINGGHCCKTNIPFDLSPPSRSHNNPFAPSPDRIDSKVGYTKENTQFVCWIYNVMKNDFVPEDVNRFVDALSINHKSQGIHPNG